MARDSIDKRTRVLVVEDVETTRNMYIRALELRGDCRADGAADLREALDALDSCTYQVALVDIMLAGAQDTANRDGAKVLERIRDLSEGTRAIVLSGQDEPQLTRDFLMDYGAADYLAKNTLQETGIGKLIELVQREADAGSVGGEPSWDELVAALAGDRDEPMFVSDVMGKLRFKGGFENLRRNLAAAIRHLAPLLPQRGSGEGLAYDEAGNAFEGKFWSKGQACAIELRLTGDDGGPAAPPPDSVMFEREKGGLRVHVTRLPEEPREAFAASG
jgi:CheY-like chemotaxis protein